MGIFGLLRRRFTRRVTVFFGLAFDMSSRDTEVLLAVLAELRKLERYVQDMLGTVCEQACGMQGPLLVTHLPSTSVEYRRAYQYYKNKRSVGQPKWRMLSDLERVACYEKVCIYCGSFFVLKITLCITESCGPCGGLCGGSCGGPCGGFCGGPCGGLCGGSCGGGGRLWR
jgi:hypothetical protein